MGKLDYGTAGHKGLSYSRRSTLHTCPRKFQLENSFGFTTRNDSVTFSYGHAVAAGIQELFLSGSREQAIIACTTNYSMPWSDTGTLKEARAKKSLWYAINAIDKYQYALQRMVYGDLSKLNEYEVAYTVLDGKEIPCIELQFRIELNDGFVYEGHIDLILRHKVTGEYVILELKTTGLNDPHDAMYANSDQALSYSIVLDRLLEGHSQASYEVYYLIYSSPKQEWILKIFPKSAKKRFDWINNLLRDCELLEYYESTAEQIPYPTNGASCFEFFSPCKYFGTCEMEDENLHTLYKQADDGKAFKYEDNVHYVFTLAGIIETQVTLAEERAGIAIEHFVDEL